MQESEGKEKKAEPMLASELNGILGVSQLKSIVAEHHVDVGAIARNDDGGLQAKKNADGISVVLRTRQSAVASVKSSLLTDSDAQILDARHQSLVS